jgi:hypothetical protein
MKGAITMGRVNETIKTINSTLRTFLAMIVIAGAGYGGYIGYSLYNEPQKKLAEKQHELDATTATLQQKSAALAARDQEIADLNTKVERLRLATRLLKVRHRMARLTVLDQHQDPSSQFLISRIEFVEISEDGQPIGEPRQFDIRGDMVYVDYLRVTFDDKYIEQSDLDRSTAICLFQRIFGEHQEAAQGYQLDEVGTRPTAYARGTEMSKFEQSIWNDFWLIANDPKRAAELGIYAAHGAAVSMKVMPQGTYLLELRTTGDLTIRPIESTALPPIPTSSGNQAAARS